MEMSLESCRHHGQIGNMTVKLKSAIEALAGIAGCANKDLTKVMRLMQIKV